ncbi:MAG TPA: M28 family metallopeptidase [Patescibacteria group bacterium]|nr:M28 family metallopeptidase [Patescibacteria group bacterium]
MGRLAGRLVMAAFALAVFVPVRGEERFSAERAMAHVVRLAETIGPRKTGTAGEREAREYIAAELGKLGLEVRRIPVPRVGTALVGSENIVGVLKGSLPDTILIGSHHDSRSSDVPGANDDASAVGVMLETARVLSSRPPVATILFASFCAEEEGLLGARQYAASQDLSRLRVVINMDPVGQREIFVSPFPVAPPLWANRALRQAAGNGIPGVIFDPLYLLVARSVAIPFGADHQPFMEKGTPAFSISDRFRTWTYHTSEDRVSWIEPATLESTGRAVIGLVRLFDQNPAAAESGPGDSTYVILPVAGKPYFIVTAAIYVLAAVVLILGALWWRSFWWKAARRERRLTLADARRALERAGIPLALAILAALASEALSEGLSGLRFSWWSHQGMHIAQGAAFAVAGLAAGWRLAAGRPAPDEREIYMVMSAGLFSLLGFVPLAIGRPDIGFYFLLPAAATLGAALLRPGWAGAGGLAGSIPLLMLVGPGNYADAVGFVDLSPPAWISGCAMLVAGLPLALGLARSANAPAGPRAARAILCAGLTAGAALLFVNLGSAGYDTLHRREIRVLENVSLGSRSATHATVRLKSAEHLRAVSTSLPGLELLDTRATERVVTVEPPDALLEAAGPLLSLAEAGSADDGIARDLRVEVVPPITIDRARITLRSTESFKMLDDGVWITRNEFSRRHVYADDVLSDSFRLSGHPGQTVEVDVLLEMTSDILGVKVRADNSVVRWLSTMTWHGSVTL